MGKRVVKKIVITTCEEGQEAKTTSSTDQEYTLTFDGIDKGEYTGPSAIFLSERSAKQILAEYYREHNTDNKLNANSPLRKYTQYDIDKLITPKMIQQYWDDLVASDDANLIIKCADSEPCTIDKFK